MYDMIVSVPDYCLSFYFVFCNTSEMKTLVLTKFLLAIRMVWKWNLGIAQICAIKITVQSLCMSFPFRWLEFCG